MFNESGEGGAGRNLSVDRRPFPVCVCGCMRAHVGVGACAWARVHSVGVLVWFDGEARVDSANGQ